MSNRTAGQTRGSELVYEALVDAGVELLIGLPGTQTLPLDRVVSARDEIRYVMARHETAVPHVAWGYYEVSGRPAATLTVPGPGDTLAMHGLKNAAEDNVPILHVSADTDPADRGKGPIHEIDPATFDSVVKANLNVERPLDLPGTIARGIELASTPPYGPVRLGIPSSILDGTVTAPPATVTVERTTYETTTDVAEAVELLASAERPLVYAGGGVRRSPEGERVVRDLADELDAPVATTYKGKGVFPENDPRWLGVTAGFVPPGARRAFERADVVLALGTGFDGLSTDHWTLPMGSTLVHVNLDPADVDNAYEADVALLGDVTAAGDAILEGLSGTGRVPEGRWNGARIGRDVRAEYREHLREIGSLDADRSPAPTPAVLRTIREAIPEEVVVVTDVGGFRLWALQTFEVESQERFVTAGSWAGMGVGVPAAVGAALAEPDHPVVALTGDGGLLMCLHELHTVAEYDLDIVVVVSNNADYGIISNSSRGERNASGPRFDWASPSYVTIAEGFGWSAERVDSAAAAGEAVARGLQRDGPTLVDVDIDPDEPSVNDAVEYESTVDL